MNKKMQILMAIGLSTSLIYFWRKRRGRDNDSTIQSEEIPQNENELKAMEEEIEPTFEIV